MRWGGYFFTGTEKGKYKRKKDTSLWLYVKLWSKVLSVTSAQRYEEEEISFLEKQKNQGLRAAAPKDAKMEPELLSMSFLLL